MKIHHLIFLLTLMVGCNIEAMVAGTNLPDLVSESELIAVATVTKVTSTNGFKIAEASIEQIIKGDIKQKKVYVLASSTWTCDISGANKGESVLLFLGKIADRSSISSNRSMIRINGRTSKPVKLPTKGYDPLYRIKHAGRGRMPIYEKDGVKYTEVWIGDVKLPQDLETFPARRNPEYSFIADIKLNALIHSVEKEIAEPAFRVRPIEGNSTWKCLSYDGFRFETSWSSKLNESEFIELKKIGYLSKVTELHFRRPDPIINSILPLFNDSPVKNIYFFEGKITSEALSKTLVYLPQLEKLSLDQVECTDGFLEHIKSPYLKELDIDFATVSEDHIHALTNLTELCRLQLPQSFSNEYYVYLKPLTKITNLTLRGDHINKDAIRCIQGLPLNKLRIYGDISDELMELLVEIQSIRDLEISSNRITDEGVKTLTGLPELTRLDLPRRTTDKSIQHINRLSKLTRLDLFGTNITDDGLSRLNLPKLKSISVRSTQVTKQGVSDFKKLHPKVSITQ